MEEKIKTRQHTADTDKKGINESIEKFNMIVQFDRNLRTDKNCQCITAYIVHLADSADFHIGNVFSRDSFYYQREF